MTVEGAVAISFFVLAPYVAQEAGWWWLDPIVALVIAALAIREGREAWAGEGCACVAFPGLAVDSGEGGCC